MRTIKNATKKIIFMNATSYSIILQKFPLKGYSVH